MIAYFAKAFCVSSRPDGRMAWVVHDSIRGDHGVPLQDLDSRATATVLPGTREKSIAKIGQLEVFVTMEDLEKEAAQRRTKSWSMLYAHMAGFAMISAGGDLQHSDFFRDDWPNSLLAVLLNVLFLLLVFWVSARLRPRGDESDMESDDEGPVEMWNENAIESEDELFCLSISFLLVQALRFQASGVLSTKAGLEPGENFGTMAILTVYGEALLFVVATVVVVFSGRTGRLADLLRGTLSMAFAWCLLFASRWMFEPEPQRDL
ncbi:unnamed protein product [Durusdinium trenchii]|uniref:GDT1 family protein n=1 Tax=Durusdinium trenchii TaxID=1381693 RepID=A0ABP0MDE3_9DINO